MRIFQFWTCVGCLALGVSALGQTPTPLARLQAEALAHNPALEAARQRWRATRAAVAPAGALPDPEIEVQQMSVRSPAPFQSLAGNMMSYIGVGATQALPYPGKLKLRAAVAASRAQGTEQAWRQAGRVLSEQIADAYIALQQAVALRKVLAEQQRALGQAERLAELRYRTGGATSQGDVLAVQLEQTELLRSLAANQEEQDEAQAQLRALLDRPPQAAAIVPEPLRSTRVPETSAQLQAALSYDPQLAIQRAQLRAAAQATALARKNFRPDFAVGYMYEHTSAMVPERYMLTLSMTLPFFHRAARQQPELEQAAADQAAARAELSAASLRERFRLTQALLQARRDSRILTIDEQGALPQAAAAARAELTAYASGNADLNSYLSAWRRELAIELEYWRTLAAHETALASVTALTGVAHE